jgi:hypothetical protein
MLMVVRRQEVKNNDHHQVPVFYWLMQEASAPGYHHHLKVKKAKTAAPTMATPATIHTQIGMPGLPVVGGCPA